ncbi:MAG: F0F1 ATP synthase subunit B [Oscillospiraceae bacterium]|nr:F0F1 ATP synthase subunit B [Oscillospiraceae bacterium]
MGEYLPLLTLVQADKTGLLAAAAEPVKTGDYFPFLTIDPVTMIATLINTLILFLVLKHFLFKPVNKILDERKQNVEETYRQADEKLTEAARLESEYTEKLANAKEESAEIVKNATKRAQTRSDEIIAEAKKEASSLMVKANADIEKEKKRAVNQIKDEISDIALAVAEKVVEKEIDPKDHERLIESFISELGE